MPGRDDGSSGGERRLGEFLSAEGGLCEGAILLRGCSVRRAPGQPCRARSRTPCRARLFSSYRRDPVLDQGLLAESCFRCAQLVEPGQELLAATCRCCPRGELAAVVVHKLLVASSTQLCRRLRARLGLRLCLHGRLCFCHCQADTAREAVDAPGLVLHEGVLRWPHSRHPRSVCL